LIPWFGVVSKLAPAISAGCGVKATESFEPRKGLSSSTLSDMLNRKNLVV